MKSAIVIESEARSARGIAARLVAGVSDPPDPPLPLHEAIIPVPISSFKSARHRSLYDQCWEVRVYFLFPVTVASYLKLVRRFDPARPDATIELAICTSVLDHAGQQIIIMGFKEYEPYHPSSAGMLAHECFHAVQYILEHRGVPLTDCTSEAYAYLLDSLVRRGTILLRKAIPLDNQPVVV